jgi:hypothetical protein
MGKVEAPAPLGCAPDFPRATLPTVPGAPPRDPPIRAGDGP